MNRTLAWIIGFASVLLLVAACGGNDESPSSTTGGITVNTIEGGTGDAATTTIVATTVASAPPVTAGGPIEPIPSPLPARVVVEGEPAYTGVLGNVGPNQWVVAPAAAPPTGVAGAAPLTGLPMDDPAAANRPAIVVKIDNSGAARPQVGLVSADIVIEERVEGGSTRLAAVMHSQSSQVGPVRSARSTDIGIVGSLGEPAFVWSGANKVFAPLITSQNIIDAGASQLPGAYSRASGRSAPHNLMSDTETIWGSVEGAAPPPQFDYRDAGEASDGDDVSTIAVTFPQVSVEYGWDGDGWARRQGGSNHVVSDGTQISPANVVVQQVDHVATGLVDPAGAAVTEDVIVGSGPVWVFTDGKVVQGTWTRPTVRSVTTLTRADGSVIELTPGRTWIEYVDDGEVSFS